MTEKETNAKTGAHHHGELESVIYVVRRKVWMRWGERLEFYAEAGEDDFVYVPLIPHQGINASSEESLICVLVRRDQEPIIVSLTIVAVEEPEAILWVDPHHPRP